MAMDRAELQRRIDACDAKIEKIKKRIAKWSTNMRPEAIELCAAFEHVGYDDPGFSEAQAAWKAMNNSADRYGAGSADLYNPNDWNKGPNFDELKCAYRDLHDVTATKNKYEIKLQEINNFENQDKIPVIVEFLENWKADAREFYLENAERYYLLKKNFDQAFAEWKAKHPEINFDARGWNPVVYEAKQNFKKSYYAPVMPLTANITTFDTHREPDPEKPFELIYVVDGYTVDEAALDKVLKETADSMYKDFVARITAVVGEITDASNLRIVGGQLNGIVEGTEGKGKVETITAGGYNTDRIVNVKHGQILHYRCLVHKLK